MEDLRGGISGPIWVVREQGCAAVQLDRTGHAVCAGRANFQVPGLAVFYTTRVMLLGRKIHPPPAEPCHFPAAPPRHRAHALEDGLPQDGHGREQAHPRRDPDRALRRHLLDRRPHHLLALAEHELLRHVRDPHRPHLHEHAPRHAHQPERPARAAARHGRPGQRETGAEPAAVGARRRRRPDGREHDAGDVDGHRALRDLGPEGRRRLRRPRVNARGPRLEAPHLLDRLRRGVCSGAGWWRSVVAAEDPWPLSQSIPPDACPGDWRYCSKIFARFLIMEYTVVYRKRACRSG
ncbi:hypothetical protein PsYK624_135670 [Phanerochaete sordida]|uniref:Uncharacterized protein n=1 Tax=Phanerochaete sordida TaxID=48140 RepID=A0A9P3GM94_9APHY|nr:hypothetical protein PsYK624_135670 [Phanerochaete sordida]